MKKTFDAQLQAMPNGCIEWTGHTIKSNGSESHRYGRFRFNGKEVLAHRFAYEQVKGQIPAGVMVLHKCDNTRCCNPEHLFVGTHADNMADMRAKGRRAGRPNTRPALGERSSAAKLTAEAVQHIRIARAAGATTVELGRQYGVSSSVISRAARGISWRHI